MWVHNSYNGTIDGQFAAELEGLLVGESYNFLANHWTLTMVPLMANLHLEYVA